MEKQLSSNFKKVFWWF